MTTFLTPSQEKLWKEHPTMSSLHQIAEGKVPPEVVGGKAQGLARMMKLSLPVPPAVTFTTKLYHKWKEDKIKTEKKLLVDGYASMVVAELQSAAYQTRWWKDWDNCKVSVRSGAPVSMPGMMDTVMNLRTQNWLDIGGAILRVLESYGSERAIAYREANGIPHDMGTAVIVQVQVYGDLTTSTSGAGVVNSVNPITGGKRVLGEWLPGKPGEDLVRGVVTPEPLGTLRKSMPTVYKMLRTGVMAIASDLGAPAEVEFVVEDKRLYFLQCRKAKVSRRRASRATYSGALLGTGIPAAAGSARGVVLSRRIHVARAIATKRPYILVRRTTRPEDFPLMRDALAFVTYAGGHTCHAAVVARSMDKPCVVSYRGEPLNKGMEVTVDGTQGQVYKA